MIDASSGRQDSGRLLPVLEERRLRGSPLASGDGCGLCSHACDPGQGGERDPRSGVRVPAARRPAVDFKFDVRLAQPTAHAPPAGGGDPARPTLRGVHTTMVAWDYPRRGPTSLTRSRPATRSTPRRLFSDRKDHPDKSFRWFRGFVRGERALAAGRRGDLLLERVETEAQMVREKGTWRLAWGWLQIRMGGWAFERQDARGTRRRPDGGPRGSGPSGCSPASGWPC